MVKIMRDVLKREGAPEDLFQCVEKPSIPLSQELMAICDLVQATGGQKWSELHIVQAHHHWVLEPETQPWLSTKPPTSKKRPVTHA